ncbi:hypothetical protein, partial [Hyphomonas polymorpha]|uniref:hypothetical protein n=1 Tax=Hyphomonas polymorpha TaxID=74319 RepID=UPI0012F73CB2
MNELLDGLESASQTGTGDSLAEQGSQEVDVASRRVPAGLSRTEFIKMDDFLKTSGVVACGLATSLLTVLLVTAIGHFTGFDLYTLSFFFIIPVGALICGAAAASGYYFGSLYFHTRPNALLILQMIVIAGITQILIYYAQYATLMVEGFRARDLISFQEYVELSLTTAQYSMGRGLQHNMGEVGQAGYWLAAIQFVGFLLGGFAMFINLRNKLTCRPCNKYLRTLSKTGKSFDTIEKLADYYDTLMTLPVDGPDFAEMIQTNHIARGETVYTIGIELHGCPDCKGQECSPSATV